MAPVKETALRLAPLPPPAAPAVAVASLYSLSEHPWAISSRSYSVQSATELESGPPPVAHVGEMAGCGNPNASKSPFQQASNIPCAEHHFSPDEQSSPLPSIPGKFKRSLSRIDTPYMNDVSLCTAPCLFSSFILLSSP